MQVAVVVAFEWLAVALVIAFALGVLFGIWLRSGP
jgi:hypothetical protein